MHIPSFSPNRRQALLASLAAGGCYFLGVRSALAAPDTGLATLEEGADKMAEAVASFLTKEGYPAQIAVGDWVGAPHLVASGGRGITEMLAAALKKHKCEVRADAQLSVLGKFTTIDAKAIEDADHNSVALRLLGEVQDRNLETLHKFNINVFGNAVLQVAGPTVDLPPNLGEGERQQKLKKAIESPHAAIVGNETRASADSPYGLEIYVGSSPRHPQMEAGRPYVSIKRNEEYYLRLYNRSPYEAAVTITIDGLSMFAFSKEGNYGSQIVIPAGKYAEIPGWYLTNQKSAKFLVTDYPESAAGKTGATASVGTITCTYSACWANNAEPPPDEGAGRGVATGLGEEVDKKYVVVKRTIGRPRATVSVRYDR